MIVEKNSLPKLINDVESNNTFDENLFRKNVGYGDFWNITTTFVFVNYWESNECEYQRNYLHKSIYDDSINAVEHKINPV